MTNCCKTNVGPGGEKLDPDQCGKILPGHIGIKEDRGKLDWDAIPLEVIESMVPAFEAGLRKGYERHNCANNFEDARRRFVSSTLRHLRACQRDPMAWNKEDGCSHAASMAFSAVMFNHHCAGIMRHKPEDF